MRLPTTAAIALAVLTTGALAQTMPGEALLLLDGDGDGQVSFEEYSEKMNPMFDQMDTNQNGQITYGEVEGFMGKDVFDATDANDSGNISRQEYRDQIKADFENADKDGDGSLD